MQVEFLDKTLVYLVGGAVGGVVLFAYGFALWRRKRLIEDTPTSKVRSMPMGRVEIHGRAQEKAELTAPITGSSCVYYRYKVEERRGSGKNERWVTVESGDSSAWGFYLEDDTGSVLIEPERAEILLEPDYQETNPVYGGALQGFVQERGLERRSWLGWRRRMRFSEWHIAPGDELYVLGVAQARAGIAQERRARIAEKLRALKSDPEAMAHLDLDADGSVSAEEWEVARRLAVQQVHQEGVEDRVSVGRDSDGNAPFFISDRDEKAVVGRLRWQVAGSVYGGASLTLVCLGFLLNRFGLLGGL